MPRDDEGFTICTPVLAVFSFYAMCQENFDNLFEKQKQKTKKKAPNSVRKS